ncbi:ABC transporter substrate-binding protein [Agrobacterium rubi]|uniref:ABC transporter substrate-binding protein n=1 Tax=Agrobacterium rubi TaxID=28099 RepID=A0AAE7UPE3_9HYPH|nr:ABC transporter substrate-binding protein [Agrobacterium rubi]NTE88073.1 ABC transporter substrate-binding protein [Agrobacterium rubi]NTF03840.1 ABC transporter substrate-binding protein [Agrobacterium rubi]NTF38167.1 ABC transporter substrate-binding protein [Agrobacterium rubi]OCJ43673.1 peptide ABC transporter substrate-binding protein [Agrobacterium rubi]QTG01928.1 ABC transporter substrate-binding protein [Agrobacterium rubi]
MIISKTFRTAVLATALLGGVSSAALAADLTIGVRAGPLSIDPDFTAAGTHAEAMKHIYDSLIKSGNNLELEPGLATSWTAIDDSTWEFKLRPGVKFHDGSDFTAEDVKFSIERISRVAGPNPTTIYVRRVKGVEIVDPLTIRVKTDGPAPNLPNDFIRLFVVSHIAAKDYSDSAEKASEGFNSGKAAIGTGPYKFVSWTPKEQLVLERFDGYWGGKEPWDKVIRKELPNDAARVAQLKAGQVDLIARIPASDVPTLEQDSKLTIVRQDSVYLFNIAFDFRDKSPQISAKDGSPLPKNPFTDPKVREAFDLAIDREAITEIAMEGMGTVQSQLVTPNIFGYNPDVKPTKADVDKAKALLAEAGYPDGFKVTFSFTNDRLPGDKDAGTTIAQMLTAIGIQVEANAQPGAVYFPANTRGDYSLTMSGWGTLTGEANYTLSSLVHTNEPAKKLGAFNIRGYSNPALDKLIEQAGVEMDAGKREQYLKDANAIVASDRPNLSIASIISAWGMKKTITIVPRSDEDTLAMNIRPAK